MSASVHTQHVRMALEASYGVAPSTSAWWQTGRWHDVVTDGMVDYQDKQDVYFPNTSPETLNLNSTSPIIVSRKSEGTLKAWADSGLMGLLVTAVLGASVKTSAVTSSSLLTDQGITKDPQSFSLTAQPGATRSMRIEIKSASVAGTVTVSGTDYFDNNINELITINGAGLYYSRNAYKSVPNNGISVSGLGSGSITLISPTYWLMSLQTSSIQQSLSLHISGNPDSGGSQFIFPGIVAKSLRINMDFESPEGIITLESDLVGKFSAACTGITEHYGASLQSVWPAWGVKILRDNVVINHVSRASLFISSGHDMLSPAADSQEPQTILEGPTQVTGDVTFQVSDSVERSRWLGASSNSMKFRIFSPQKVPDLGTNVEDCLILLNKAFSETQDVGNNSDGYVLNTKFRSVITNASDLSVSIYSLYPSTAFGGQQI